VDIVLNDFYEKTTKAFDVVPTVNGVAQTISGTLSFIMKNNKNDTDAEAVIFQSNTTGQFILTPTMTAVTPRKYYYEIKWETGSEQYILESGTVMVLNRIFD